MKAAVPAVIRTLAQWTPWMPWAQAVRAAPKQPGVYLAREHPSGPLIYVGMAGERRGEGIRGRLVIYARGKALASGLGEAALDRALADPGWLRERLAEVDQQQPRRATHWGILAIQRADLHISWTETQDRASAVTLEKQVIAALVKHDLWNRRR